MPSLNAARVYTAIPKRGLPFALLIPRRPERGEGIPHPKERKPKIIYLLDEDREFLARLPLAFPDTPFFRHENHAPAREAGKRFGLQRLYRDWKAACRRLGIEGVDLYGGTKHSTAE